MPELIHRRAIAALVLTLAASVAGAQATLEVVDPAGRARTWAPTEATPRETFEASAHEQRRQWTGIDLRVLLKSAGIEPPETLRGAQLRRLVVLRAADGYAAVFGFAELDPSLGAKRVYLVDTADGKALPESDGPWRAVVPSESRPTRWVRQLRRIEVVDLP